MHWDNCRRGLWCFPCKSGSGESRSTTVSVTSVRVGVRDVVPRATWSESAAELCFGSLRGVIPRRWRGVVLVDACVTEATVKCTLAVSVGTVGHLRVWSSVAGRRSSSRHRRRRPEGTVCGFGFGAIPACAVSSVVKRRSFWGSQWWRLRSAGLQGPRTPKLGCS